MIKYFWQGMLFVDINLSLILWEINILILATKRLFDESVYNILE